MKLSIISSALVGASIFFSFAAHAAYTFTSFTGLGDLPGGDHYSYAWAISDDGSTIVGRSSSHNGTEAFMHQNGVMTGLGDLAGGGFSSDAWGVSADGSTIVGVSNSANGDEAFSFQAGSMAGLGDLTGGEFSSVARDVSADGSTIVGWSSAANGNQAFVHRNGEMTSLTHESSGALGVSADGATIVGYVANGNCEAFVYQNGVMTSLCNESFRWIDPWDVSNDGSIVVGRGQIEGDTYAFVYQNGVITALEDLNGGAVFGHAWAVSADGSTIVGEGFSDYGFHATLWDGDSLAILKVQDGLADSGIDITNDGWERLETATAISANGLTIAGYGSHNGKAEAWVATIAASPVPVPGAIWLFGSGLLGLVAVKRRN